MALAVLDGTAKLRGPLPHHLGEVVKGVGTVGVVLDFVVPGLHGVGARLVADSEVFTVLAAGVLQVHRAVVAVGVVLRVLGDGVVPLQSRGRVLRSERVVDVQHRLGKVVGALRVRGASRRRLRGGRRRRGGGLRGGLLLHALGGLRFLVGLLSNQSGGRVVVVLLFGLLRGGRVTVSVDGDGDSGTVGLLGLLGPLGDPVDLGDGSNGGGVSEGEGRGDSHGNGELHFVKIGTVKKGNQEGWKGGVRECGKERTGLGCEQVGQAQYLNEAPARSTQWRMQP